MRASLIGEGVEELVTRPWQIASSPPMQEDEQRARPRGIRPRRHHDLRLDLAAHGVAVDRDLLQARAVPRPLVGRAHEQLEAGDDDRGEDE